MAGYYKWSMSNNALEAYAEGKKPLSKWTKQAIISEATNNGFSESHVNQLKKTTLQNLRESCLEYTECHHTSKMYKITNFFEMKDEEAIFAPNRKLARKELKELQEEFKYDKGILTYNIKKYPDWVYRSVKSTEKAKEPWGDIEHQMVIVYLSDSTVLKFINEHNKK